jgi:hypothetical protein
MTDWDPASKQPLFKTAAAQVERISALSATPMSTVQGGRA